MSPVRRDDEVGVLEGAVDLGGVGGLAKGVVADLDAGARGESGEAVVDAFEARAVVFDGPAGELVRTEAVERLGGPDPADA